MLQITGIQLLRKRKKFKNMAGVFGNELDTVHF